MFVCTLSYNPKDIDIDHYGYQDPLPDKEVWYAYSRDERGQSFHHANNDYGRD